MQFICYFFFPLNSWSFFSSFSWSNICRLPPLTMNNYSFVRFLFDQCCTQHQSQIWNKEVVKQSQRKGKKCPKDIGKKEGGISGEFFLWKIPIFSFLWQDNKTIPWMLFLLTQPGVLKSKSESLNCTICLYPAHY